MFSNNEMTSLWPLLFLLRRIRVGEQLKLLSTSNGLYSSLVYEHTQNQCNPLPWVFVKAVPREYCNKGKSTTKGYNATFPLFNR